jgi:hypothetical protein
MAPGIRGRIALFHQAVGVGAVAVLCAVLSGCGADETASSDFTVGGPGAAGMSGGSPMGGQAGGALGGAGGQAARGGAGGQAGTSVASSGTGGSGGTGGAGPAAGAGGATAGMGGSGMGGTGGGGAGGSSGPVPTGEICARWKADRASLSEGMWTGSVDGCQVGETAAEALENAHRLHTLYRFMAGLEPVEMTDEGNRLAQGCALLMAANGRISHTPDSSWTCFTEEAADTAGTSSLSGGGVVSSVDGYMIDPGNPTTLGHRRWILSNMLASVGFGGAGRFSCQYQPAQRPAPGAKAWIAWPPPGEVPIQSFGSRFATIDETGWSVQSDTIDLQSAQVAVTSDGMDLAVTTTPLNRGYGSTHALRFNPMGWTTAAGKTYSVKLSGTSMPIEYEVKVVDCP